MDEILERLDKIEKRLINIENHLDIASNDDDECYRCHKSMRNQRWASVYDHGFCRCEKRYEWICSDCEDSD